LGDVSAILCIYSTISNSEFDLIFALLAGGRPAATHFILLRACAARKKVSKQKATTPLPPSGVPVCASQKMGNGRNSLRADNAHF
jgi:hypothetical protein